MDTSKPGYKTSEFWLTVASVLVGALAAAFGLIPPDQAEHTPTKCIACGGGLLQAAVVAFAYIRGRLNLKEMTQATNATIVEVDPDDEGEEWKRR